MGCMFSQEIEEKKDVDLVGNASGRSKRDLDLKTVPKERLSMVNVELIAEKETIYRPKHVKFPRQNSLDYNVVKNYHALRKIMDEPVGRFYFREYAVVKKIEGLEDLINCWSAIELLEMEGAEVKQVAEKLAKEAAEKKVEDGEEDEKEPDVVQKIMTTEERVNDIVEKYLLEESPNRLKITNEASQEKLTEQVQTLSETAKTGFYSAPEAKSMFCGVQNIVFREMGDGDFIDRFKEHSEYKRYKMKMAKVYNAISHRDFDFMATLGKGSFGRVLAVRKRTTKRMYALKVMSKKKILGSAESASQVTIERNVLVTCSDCRFIVTPSFAFQTTRALFLAIELLEGGNLLSAMSKNGGSLPIDVVRFHSAQILLGLAYLHKHGIIYRDLKPLNVMLDRHGNAVLTDMGLCCKIAPSQFPKSQDGLNSSGQKLKQRKSMEQIKLESLKCVGTFGFRAPEVLEVSKEKKGYGPPVDYWALGVTIFYLLQGKYPFKEKVGKSAIFGPNLDQKAAERKMHNNRRSNPEPFDPALIRILDGLLEVDPNKRLGSDVEALKKHDFYSTIDWEKLENGTLKSPYQTTFKEFTEKDEPQFDGLAEAMSNFSADNVLEMFGGENDMQDEYTHVRRKDQRLFKEWDYFPDDSLQLDWDLLKSRKKAAVSIT